MKAVKKLTVEEQFIKDSESIVTEDFIQEILTKTLHGSGWDGDWTVTQLRNKKFLCEIQYHPMDEHEGYDGWFGINFYVDRNLKDFRMTFSATKRHRVSYIDFQKDYYEDCFYYALDDVLDEVIKLLAAKFYTGE